MFEFRVKVQGFWAWGLTIGGGGSVFRTVGFGLKNLESA